MHDEETGERLVGRITVAHLFECAPASVDRYEERGIIPPRRRLSGGRVAWLYSELVAAMRALPAGRLTDRTTAAREAQRLAREHATSPPPEVA